MNKNFLLVVAGILSLNVNFAQAAPGDNAPAENNTFVLVVKATVDSDGQISAITDVLEARKLNANDEQFRRLNIEPFENTFNSGFNRFSKGIEHTIEGACIMLLVVGEKAAPYIVDLTNNIVIPVCKKSFNGIIRPLSQKAYSQIVKLYRHYFNIIPQSQVDFIDII